MIGKGLVRQAAQDQGPLRKREEEHSSLGRWLEAAGGPQSQQWGTKRPPDEVTIIRASVTGSKLERQQSGQETVTESAKGLGQGPELRGGQKDRQWSDQGSQKDRRGSREGRRTGSGQIRGDRRTDSGQESGEDGKTDSGQRPGEGGKTDSGQCRAEGQWSELRKDKRTDSG